MDENTDHPAEPSPPERDDASGGSGQIDRGPIEVGQIDRLEMTPPSLWTRGMTAIAVVEISLGLWFYEFIVAALQAPQVPWRILAMILGPPLIFGIYVLWRWWDKPGEPRALVFHDDHLTLPVSPNSKRSVELAYEDVKGLLMMSRGPNHTLLVDTGAKTLSYSEGDFVRNGALALLRDALLARIHRLPNADEVIREMRDHQKLARIATSKPATATKVFLGILAAYFAVELWMGIANDPFGLLELGANAPFLIDQGQYFRLISANFLHQGWVHIILNGVALLFLGGLVEKLMGPWRMVLIYLVGAIAGSYGSYLAGPGMVSVGSSTAIFGLFGAFLVLHIRHWRELPAGIRQSVTWWVVIIGINAALPAIVPIIDYMAHLTGFIGGGVAAWALLAPTTDLKPDRRPSNAVKIVTGLVTAIFVAGLVQAGIYAVENHPRDEERVFGNMLDQMLEGEAAPEEVNQIAWMTATNPEASEGQLERAREAVEQVVGQKDDRLEIRDTLATVNYRLAQKSTGARRLELVDEAITIEQKVLEQADPGPDLMGGGQPTYASQLARFLNYRRQIEAPLIRKAVLDSPPTMSFNPSKDGPSLTVEAPAETPDPVAIYAVARVDGQVKGLVKTCLASGQQQRVITGQTVLDRWPDDMRLLPGLVEPASECSEALAFWPMTPEIRELP